jgi:uncharacterized phiE125 gp8 family phage protein
MLAKVWSVYTAPALDPVTLTEAKSQLRVTGNEEDTLILAYLRAATRYAENYLGRALITQTLEAKFERFPCGYEALELPQPPLQSVTSIVYRSAETTYTTLPTTEYEVDVVSPRGRIILGYGKSWPTTLGMPMAFDVTVRYVAGYGVDSTYIPATIRSAILMFLAHLYEQREAVTDQIVNVVPFGVQAMLDQERMNWGT